MERGLNAYAFVGVGLWRVTAAWVMPQPGEGSRIERGEGDAGSGELRGHCIASAEGGLGGEEVRRVQAGAQCTRMCQHT